MFHSYHKIKENFVSPRKSSGYTPLQLAKLYNFPEADGTGQTIGIIELGGGYKLSDITTYLSNLGITTTPNIVDVSVDGATNNVNDGSGANTEVVLDIQIIIALVPASKIRVYFSPNTDTGFYNAIQQAINECNIVSISWGGSENQWDPKTLSNFNTLFKTGSEKGVTIFAAAGDNGASDGGRGLNVDFPGSSPYVVSCGGTSVTSNGDQILQEVVWNNNPTTSSTGGGISTVFPKPSYQNSIVSLNSIKFRCVPDVSGNADPNTGYIIYIDGQSGQVGGTSAVSPLWSAYTARINQKYSMNVGFLQPKLYASSTDVLRDVTTGNNGGFSASLGYDMTTGLGSPSLTYVQYIADVKTTVPAANFNTNIVSGVLPLTVNFTDTSSNQPTTWSWDFTDGTSSNLQNVSHTFRSAGTYNVSLTVSNSSGSSIAKKTITVTNPSTLMANFNCLTVNFKDLSNGATSFLWSFGDGYQSTQQNPVHTYAKSGKYTVTLTVKNSIGAVSTTKNRISLN